MDRRIPRAVHPNEVSSAATSSYRLKQREESEEFYSDKRYQKCNLLEADELIDSKKSMKSSSSGS